MGLCWLFSDMFLGCSGAMLGHMLFESIEGMVLKGLQWFAVSTRYRGAWILSPLPQVALSLLYADKFAS